MLEIKSLHLTWGRPKIKFKSDMYVVIHHCTWTLGCDHGLFYVLSNFKYNIMRVEEIILSDRKLGI